MRTILILTFALAMYGSPADADDGCGMNPCRHHNTMAAIVPSTEPLPDMEAAPARVAVEVMFYNPVWVDGKVLMGRHVVEHDTDRMARGEPCTHIYAHNDRRFPVVTFHCTHLIRPRGAQNSVTLRRDYNALGQGSVMTEFQFAGDREAHGVPGVRAVDPVR